MSMAKPFRAGIALLFAAAAGGAGAADVPGLGKPANETELALWDMSIGPDGRGLPPGGGTAAQGAVIFAQKCEGCHGKDGAGGSSAMLVNPSGKNDRNMANYAPTATTIFDFTRRAMPYTQPKFTHR
jgi:mono/diheme cytochrome c family protein